MTVSWKYLIVTLAIGWFIGAASGMVISHWCHNNPSHGRHGKKMREKFFRELELTPEQQAQMDAIWQTNHPKIAQVYADARTQLEAIRLRSRTQMRALLTPEQQVKFDKVDAKFQEHFKQKLSRLQD